MGCRSVQKYFRQFFLGVSLVQILNPPFADCFQSKMPQDAPAAGVSTSHDFDFLIGNWVVHHRRLKHRLAHSDDWETFSGTCEMKILLGGSADVDDNVLDTPEGMYRAVSLRAFEPATKKWSIWWLDGRHPRQLDPPVVGEFSNGIGVFLADDSWNGKPIQVRFIWSDITPSSARWQQSFSPDAGKTWEINWIMDFRRASGQPAQSSTAAGY